MLDRALELGELDFVEEVSRELPIRMLCRILGVPEEDAGELVEWGDALISNADPEFSMAVIDQVDTEEFRLLPFRSPAAHADSRAIPGVLVPLRHLGSWSVGGSRWKLW